MLTPYSRIMIVGSESQLGLELVSKLSKNYKLYTFSKKQLDITNADWTRSLIHEIKPNIIFNTAAYTNVERAEIDREKAYSVNGSALYSLGLSSREVNASVVHFSTDYVFDGEANSPYLETDSVNPINVYGKSKLIGEKELEKSGANHIVVRFGWLYGRYGDNFVKKILRSEPEINELKVVNDQFGTPTSTEFVVENLTQILSMPETNTHTLPKLLHLTPSGETNWFGFAQKILEFANEVRPGQFPSKKQLVGIDSSYYGGMVERPRYSVLSKGKFEEITGSRVDNWEATLRVTIEEMLN